ncbi:MAG: hypothetical protein GY755_09330 [Chloroflexi bacterium]|nr:hypothetical protein [Chloroflexota bacterium]
MDKAIHHIRFLPLLILAMLVNILSQTTHETGHHVVYQAMGHKPVWAFTKLVQVWDTPPASPDEWVEISSSEDEQGWLKLSSPIKNKTENIIATTAGPLAGLLGSLLGLIVMRRRENIHQKQIALAFSLTSSLVATLYYLRAPMRTGGDEFDIAMQLGISKSFIETPLALAFLACLILALRQLPSWRIRLTWLGTILLGSIATGIPMVFADNLIIANVNAGNFWFTPILGYSFPVFLVNTLTLFWIWGWLRWQIKSKA